MRTFLMQLCFITLTFALSSPPLLGAPPYKYSAPWIGNDLSGAPCHGPRQSYGPYDYRKRKELHEQLRLVEGAHFTPRVEMLIQGKTGVDPYGDIAYTVRAWPNHHRALNSMMRYYFSKKNTYNRVKLPLECYFQRALHFAPDDSTVYMLYAIYLQKIGQLKLSEENYKKGLAIDGKNRQMNYNYGLLLVDLKEYKKAKEFAKKAYSQSYPLPGLKNKLKDAGYWP